MESVEHQYALEEHYVAKWNGNTNDADFLSATINIAATDENFIPPADEPITAPPPVPTPSAPQLPPA